MVIDQVLPDGHGVAAPAERRDDQFAVGLAGARPRRRPGRSLATAVAAPVPVPAASAADESVGTSTEMAGFDGRVEAGHGPAPPARRPSGPASRLASDSGGVFDEAPQPAEAPQRHQTRFSSAKTLLIPGRNRLFPTGVNEGRYVRNGRFSTVH